MALLFCTLLPSSGCFPKAAAKRTLSNTLRIVTDVKNNRLYFPVGVVFTGAVKMCLRA